MSGKTMMKTKPGATFSASLVDVNGEVADFATADLTAWAQPEHGRGPAIEMSVAVIDAETIGLTISKNVTVEMAPGVWEFEVHFGWPDGTKDKTTTGYFELERAINGGS